MNSDLMLTRQFTGEVTQLWQQCKVIFYLVTVNSWFSGQWTLGWKLIKINNWHILYVLLITIDIIFHFKKKMKTNFNELKQARNCRYCRYIYVCVCVCFYYITGGTDWQVDVPPPLPCSNPTICQLFKCIKNICGAIQCGGHAEKLF